MFFYNSGCNIADIKCLFLHHKNKLSQYKSSNRSREWGFKGKHFRGGQSPVNASNKSTALVDCDKAFHKCNVECKQNTNDMIQVQDQSTESSDPVALNEGFIVEANYPNMSDKAISGSDITDSDQRSNNMGIK